MWDTLYRPMKFADVLGQPGTIQLLKSRLKNGSAFDTSYIFSGSHGMGKTTLARIFSRAALCQDLNKEDPEPCNACDNCQGILNGDPGAFEERDAASSGTVETVREMIKDLPFLIANAPKRIWLFDESHRMSIGAQDALLLPLEEKKVVGVFCTTEPDKIRGPIRSRCEEYTIRKVTREDILSRMKIILTKEEVQYEDDAVLTVIDYCGGHVRDVFKKLEMVAQLGDITLGSVRECLNLSLVTVYYEILLAIGSPKAALDLMEQACDRVSAEDVAAGLAEAAMNSYRLANNMFADFVQTDKALAKKVYDRYGSEVIRLAEYFLRSRGASRLSLACDIVNLSRTSGTIPAPTEMVTPVIVQVAPVSTSTAPSAMPPARAPESTPAKAPTEPPKATNGKTLRPDGIGVLGSGDVSALTDLDDRGVPQTKPRDYGMSEPRIPFSIQASRVDDDNRIIQPDEWRREFDRTWPRN